MKNEFENKIRFELLNLLSKNPELTQRQMQKQLEVSLGKVNKCLSKLAEKGWIKVDRFKKADNKPAYLYTITTAGYQEVINLNLQLLQTKISEYSEIKNEIDQLDRKSVV